MTCVDTPPCDPADAAAVAALEPVGFGFPGPLRRKLNAAILDGGKTSTTSLVEEYGHNGETFPEPGARWALIDDDGRPLAVCETTEVRVRSLGEVDLQHALDEGEGDTSVAEWRATHESFWHSEQYRAGMGDPAFTVTDATEAVLERFRVLVVLAVPE